LKEGRGNTFITFLKKGRKGDCLVLETPEKIRELHRGNYIRRPSRKRSTDSIFSMTRFTGWIF